MSNTQHTQGPWVADIETYPIMVRSQTETWPLVDELGNEEGRAGAFIANTGDNKANARLIAAAPELLESLRDCLDFCEKTRGADGIVEVIRAAIARATGVAA